MKGVNEVRKGDYVVLSGEPFEVVDREHIAMQQRRAGGKLKVKSLKTGKVKEESMLSQGEIEEAEINREEAIFAYDKRGEFWFHKEGKPAERFVLDGEILGEQVKFLKPKMKVMTIGYSGEVVAVKLPIKGGYEVKETPPPIKGATAAGGNKPATLETGAVVAVPMFVETGDKIVVNTERGEYDSRV